MIRSSFLLEPDGPGVLRRLLLRLSGDADAVERGSLDAWRRALAHPVSLHVDLADLGFVGAAFLDFLVGLTLDVEAGGGRLTLGPIPPRVSRLFVVCGLDARFAPLVAEATRPALPEAAPASER